MNLTEICIKKPLVAWMIMAATVLFGGVAATRIGISQFPDVDFPTLSISVSWEGASPEAVEHDLIEPLEEAVIQVEGIRAISSSARQGGASITVELDLSRDVDLAMQDVQAKVSQARQRLPRDVDPPVISKTNPEDQPIMWVGLAGALPQQVLSDTALYVLKEKLQTVPGVGEVTMGGSLERNVRVWIDATQLNEKGLTITDILSALRREHVELPVGRLQTSGREVNVRLLGEAVDLAALRRMVIREVAGAPVYLEEVALVEDGFEDVRRLSRVNGVPAQGLGIKKQRGANAVAVARGVRAALSAIAPTLPAGMEVGINFDSTQFIEESVHEVAWELLLAVGLTALVCWLFLGTFSSALNVILAIPMSLLGTIAVIYFLGYTLNTFTLLALSLSVGIVVDDAIMVLENIFRHAEGGKDRVRAAREGTAEITFSALAATLAVVAIFIPVVFMPGIVGKFFLQFGVTLSVAVMLSYLEAVTLAPARCSQWLATSRAGRGRIGRVADDLFAWLAARYAGVLKRGLRWPLSVLAGAVILLCISGVVLSRLKSEFVPSQDQSRLLVRLQAAVGADLSETDRLFQRAEAYVATRPEIRRTFAVVGGFGGGGVNTGVLFLSLVPPDEREMSQSEFSAVLRKELNTYPGLRAVVQDLSQQGFTAQRGFPVEFSVQGPEWEPLVEFSRRTMDALRESGAVVDLDSNYAVGIPELRITPNRAAAADLGVSVEEVATTLNALVGGTRAGKYSTGGRRIDIRLKLLAAQRSRPEDLDRLYVRNREGTLIPLLSLITHEERPALQAITRRDRERAINVFANVAPGHAQNEVLAIIESLGREAPTGYRLVPGGQSAAFQESMSGLLWALLLGIVVAYMILVAQFNSLLHPVTVLTLLPLSIAGAAFALFATGHSLNIFSMIGLLLLMGIVKKNAIILVDYANQVRARGVPGDPAVGPVQNANEDADAASAAMRVAGPVRLRPILMTSVTTLMAAVPAALALGPGSEIRAPMAIAVIGGLFVSTALSLLVVPAFYVVTDRVRRRVMAWRRPTATVAEPRP